MGLRNRLNASDAEFWRMLTMTLEQKIQHIKIKGIAEDLTEDRLRAKEQARVGQQDCQEESDRGI
jgi:hypothetical protein